MLLLELFELSADLVEGASQVLKRLAELLDLAELFALGVALLCLVVVFCRALGVEGSLLEDRLASRERLAQAVHERIQLVEALGEGVRLGDDRQLGVKERLGK